MKSVAMMLSQRRRGVKLFLPKEAIWCRKIVKSDEYSRFFKDKYKKEVKINKKDAEEMFFLWQQHAWDHNKIRSALMNVSEAKPDNDSHKLHKFRFVLLKGERGAH